jgi:transposase
MPRKSTPSFIHQLPLRTTRAQLAALNKRFDVAHFAYNVTLQAMLQRLQAMRRDPQFDAACKSPRETAEQRIERSRRFSDLRKQYGFSEYAAHDIVASHIRASGYLDGLIDSHTAQTLATRAFKACEAYAVGLRGRPRFKRCGEIASIEGKGPSSPLQWKDDHLVWGGKRRDRRMVLRPIFDKLDKAGVQAHALSGRVKFVRLVRKSIKGRTRFFVQLVCEGQALQRFEARDETAAIDLGPSTAAIVAPGRAALVSFLPEIQEDLKAKRRLQRSMDRSRRATNPQCFNDNGTWRPGSRIQAVSSRYKALRNQHAEQERAMAARRDRAHGRLANIVLRDFGRVVNTERLSKQAWQKMWGRRMKATAPAMFMEKVSRKAENAGGSLVEFNAARFKLSQYDHTQQDFLKKPLSQRWHVLRDGSGQVVQRDLYSAYLALFVQADGLDASRAQEAWAVAYPLLAHAASNLVKAASWRPLATTRPLEDVAAARMREQSERSVRSTPQVEEPCVTL